MQISTCCSALQQTQVCWSHVPPPTTEGRYSLCQPRVTGVAKRLRWKACFEGELMLWYVVNTSMNFWKNLPSTVRYNHAPRLQTMVVH